MVLSDKGYQLRIYTSETDKYEGMPLYEWIVHKAHKHGLSGATAFRGIEGYGNHSQLHTSKILRLSNDLPVVIEIIDKKQKIEEFLDIINPAISEGMVTIQDVEFSFHQKKEKT